MLVAAKADVLVPLSQATGLAQLTTMRCSTSTWFNRLSSYIQFDQDHFQSAFLAVGAGCTCDAHTMIKHDDYDKLDRWVRAHPLSFASLEADPLTELELERFAACTLIHLAGGMLKNPYPNERATFDPRTVANVPDELRANLKPTRVRVGALEALLAALQLHDEYNDVIQGFAEGFRLGYQADRTSLFTRSRIPDEAALQDHLRNHLETETKVEGRILGPFPYHPTQAPSWLSFIRFSPISLLPKRTCGLALRDKFRLIWNGSWGKLFGVSVNDGIPREVYACRFVTFDTVVTRVLILVFAGGQWILLWKTDLVSAFRIAQVHPDDWPLLGFEYQGSAYLDTRLPFGVVSGPFTFQRISNSVKAIGNGLMANPLEALQPANVREASSLDALLDDFFQITAGPRPEAAKLSMCSFMALLEIIGIEAAPDKTFSPRTRLTIFGLQIDTIAMEISLPAERLAGLKMLLNHWEDKDEYTKREIQSLVGVLVFCSYGIRWGRAFIHRLIKAIRPLKFAKSRTKITQEMRDDMRWWKQFALDPHYKGVSIIVDPHIIYFSELDAYTDSTPETCAGGFGDVWFLVEFYGIQLDWSISAKELYSFVTLCGTHGPKFTGKTICLLCDNEASVITIKSMRAHCPVMATLVRELFYICARYSFQVVPKHIPGVKNVLADRLSRPNLRHQAWEIRRTLDRHPSTPVLPTMLW